MSYTHDSEDDFHSGCQNLLLLLLKTSVIVNNNSCFQNYTNPDDHTRWITDTPGFKPLTKYVELFAACH